MFRRTVQGCWLPTPFGSFPLTSPPVRHRVPSGSERPILIYQNMTKCHKREREREREILIFTAMKKLKFHIRARGKMNIIASTLIYCVPKLMQLEEIITRRTVESDRS